MYGKIVQGAEVDIPLSISKSCRDLLLRLLERDPKKRIGALDIRSHPFFHGVEWDRVCRRDYPAPFVPGLV